MIIACPCGKKKFEVEASLIPNEGKLLQCGACSKKWFFQKELQKKVWGHNSSLETHTVETHIYRLRKKISEKFKDKNFINSTKKGYII